MNLSSSIKRPRGNDPGVEPEVSRNHITVGAQVLPVNRTLTRLHSPDVLMKCAIFLQHRGCDDFFFTCSIKPTGNS